MQEHHNITILENVIFVESILQSSITQALNLVSPFLQNHFCLSLCLSSQKLGMQKSIHFKISNNSFPLPTEKSSPHLPLAPQTMLSFCSLQHFPVKLLLFGIEVLAQRHSIIILHNYLTIKLIINRAQFSLVKTDLSCIAKMQNKSRCMYCRLPLGNKKMKRDIINSESTKMTRKCQCPIKLTITSLFI